MASPDADLDPWPSSGAGFGQVGHAVQAKPLVLPQVGIARCDHSYALADVETEARPVDVEHDLAHLVDILGVIRVEETTAAEKRWDVS